MDIGRILLVILVIAIIEILLLLIFREVICWYHKINERLNQQRQTNALLEKLYSEISTQNGNAKGGQM